MRKEREEKRGRIGKGEEDREEKRGRRREGGEERRKNARHKGPATMISRKRARTVARITDVTYSGRFSFFTSVVAHLRCGRVRAQE
jgi:hypothetical protein